MAKTAIALGSNLGNSLSILEQALIRLAHTQGITLESASSWYKTTPIGPPQPDYLNACAILTTTLTPHRLLTELFTIEQEFGRVRQQPQGPRTLDLDILLYDDLIIQTEELEIPHPRMRERGFVLVPLAEIAPNWQDPVTKKALADLVKQVDTSGVCLWQKS